MNKSNPPKILERLLEYFVDEPLKYSAMGDYGEMYHYILEKDGRVKANYWYVMQLFKRLLTFFSAKVYRNFAMLKSYIKIAFRNVLRHKVFSIINISGLAIGIASCMFILLYVKYELSFDRYHEKADNIYRIVTELYEEGVDNSHARTSNPLAPELTRDLPEIKMYTRVMYIRRLHSDKLIRYNDKKFEEEEEIYLADPDFFRIFSYEFIAGDPESALLEPNSVVLTEEGVRRIFGDEEALGKSFAIGSRDYMVTGVIKNVPDNSHFRFNYLASLTTIKPPNNQALEDYGTLSGYAYVLLENNVNPRTVEEKIPELAFQYSGDQNFLNTSMVKTRLQKLTDIHLKSHLRLEYENNTNTSEVNITIFSVTAIIILLIACINFMNLSTAKSTVRAREVGLRKVFGSHKKQLINQFLGESLFIAIFASVIAVAIVVSLLPFFRDLVQRNIVLENLFDGTIIFIFLSIVFSVGFLSGIYPAFFLSAFRPIAVLKGKVRSGSKNNSLRKALIVVQFMISTILISGTLLVFNQLAFMKNKHLGFDKENLLVVPIQESIASNYETVKNELLRSPNVLAATATRNVPGYNIAFSQFKRGGADLQDEEGITFQLLMSDLDFVSTYGVQILWGRNFSKDIIGDRGQAFIINEQAAKVFGWEGDEAIGKQIRELWPNEGLRTVIGVAKDFHQKSLKETIPPIIMGFWPERINTISLRINNENISTTIAHVKETIERFAPEREFKYFFLDEDLNRHYQSDENLGRLFTYFVLLAIFIACLGLYGLVSFTTEQRTKEIGTRKVLGASVKDIIMHLVKDFVRLVVVANIIACPIAYIIMSRWLESFAYRANIDPFLFIVSGVLSLVVALATVGYQSVKTALSSPVESLRYE